MAGDPIRILLVEDNPGDVRLLRETLRDAPRLRYELDHAGRLSEACERLDAGVVDVLLLDLSLPDAHGMATVARALEAAPEVPIIVLTGLDDETLAVQAVHAGAQDYLPKGQLDPTLLARSIRYAMERKRFDRERLHLLASEKAARERAEAALRARDDVLHVVSHDLGNSLSAIVVNASFLIRTLPEDDAGVRTRIAGIRDLAKQMQRLRQDLLDVASIEAGRLSLEPGEVRVGELLEALHERFEPLAAEKEISLLAENRTGELTISADRERLLQALGNLLGNAVKFTPPGGTVTVQAEREGGLVHLRVHDTGPGIAPGSLPRVFDRFYTERAGNPRGTGLGLAIARGLAEAHGGRIGAESVEGKGSTFSITVPVSR
jgi:signal transduction histidine kinase